MQDKKCKFFPSANSNPSNREERGMQGPVSGTITFRDQDGVEKKVEFGVEDEVIINSSMVMLNVRGQRCFAIRQHAVKGGMYLVGTIFNGDGIFTDHEVKPSPQAPNKEEAPQPSLQRKKDHEYLRDLVKGLSRFSPMGFNSPSITMLYMKADPNGNYVRFDDVVRMLIESGREQYIKPSWCYSSFPPPDHDLQ